MEHGNKKKMGILLGGLIVLLIALVMIAVFCSRQDREVDKETGKDSESKVEYDNILSYDDLGEESVMDEDEEEDEDISTSNNNATTKPSQGATGSESGNTGNNKGDVGNSSTGSDNTENSSNGSEDDENAGNGGNTEGSKDDENTDNSGLEESEDTSTGYGPID